MRLNINIPILLSKVIIILLLSIGVGFALVDSIKSDNVKAKELTLEKYTAGYQEYKESLKSDSTFSMAQYSALIFIFALILFGVYEFIAWIISLALTSVFKPLRSAQEELERGRF